MNEPNNSTGIALAVQQAGTQEKLGQHLGVSQQAVSQWMEKGWVPLARALQIEERFSIPRSRLVDPRIVELLTASPAQS